MPKSPVKALLSVFLYTIVSISSFFTSVAQAEITANLADGDSLELIGIGKYQELRNDIYIGALFGPAAVTDVEQLKNDQVAKRMSLRFVSDYSNRKLARHWKERMAMNNPRSKWQPLTREIVGFSKLFKRSLVPGDEINIDHVPGVGTQVYLNSTLFETFNKPGFVDVLLNVWLGNIPPTKAFKASIRGQDSESVKSSFIAEYSGIEPEKGRFDADLTPVVVAKPPEPKKETPKPQVTKVAKKEPPKQAPVKQQPVNKPPVKKQETKVAEQPPVKVNTVAKPAQSEPKKQTAVANKPAQSKPAPQKVAKIEPPVIEEDFFDADLIAGSYTRDLINEIRKHQEYPRRALINKDEGDVTARVTIAADGSLLGLELVERSGSRILDKAVMRIIRKTAPFQQIPTELDQEQFVFEVPISFQL